MGAIFYLMGKSSTGKDTIYKALLSDKELNLKRIIPYTTRPIREGEENGIEYIFTDEPGLQELIRKNVVIEQRSYDTFYGVWKYFTVFDGQINLLCNNYIMIGTPDSFATTQKYFGSSKIIPILIELNDGIRLQRALDREKSQSNPKFEEMCRRFLTDSSDFSEEKIKEYRISNCFANEDLKKCISDITSFIKNNIYYADSNNVD